jgi:hypothetical protein
LPLRPNVQRATEPSQPARLLIAQGVPGVAGARQSGVLNADDLFGGSESGRSVAVLPFANLSGDPEQRYFSDG